MPKTVFVRITLVFLLIGGIGLSSYAQTFTWTGSPYVDLHNFPANGAPGCTPEWIFIPVSLPAVTALNSCGSIGLEYVSIQCNGVDALNLSLDLYNPAFDHTVHLTSNNGGYWNEFGARDANGTSAYACFNGSAASSITSIPSATPIIGEYRPEGNMNTFNDGTVDPNGTWYILAEDLVCWFGLYLYEIKLTFGDCLDPTISPCYTPVLPIDLLSFAGEAQNEYNLLNWSTASELNNDYFVVENSSDGITFKELTIVAGGGNSNSTIEYSFQHFRPSTTEYYRLKQVDFDGQFEYSKIVAVSSNGQFDLVIFPNPSKGSLSFSINEGSDNLYTVRYTSVLGKVIEETVNISQGTNTYQLKGFEDLDRGIYAVQIFNKEQKTLTSQKIVKQ